MRKIWLLGGLVGAAVLIGTSQRKDIARYLKIKNMSSGGGHPENVPAGGSHSYPSPGNGVTDGTGDFDAASRGGGAEAKTW
jgi:hypothetical protein